MRIDLRLNERLEKHSPRYKIIGMGGGTGLATLLKGLKWYNVDLTAIVAITDNGGSSGVLRDDLHIPPPGDVRNCLTALAKTPIIASKLFSYRFSNTNSPLDNHSMGNLVLAGLTDIVGDFAQAVREMSKILAIEGVVLPAANNALSLMAHMEDGNTVIGEVEISKYPSKVQKMSLLGSDLSPLPESVEAIKDADMIVIGPGSIYTSLVPNLLLDGMRDELINAKAKKVFVCNVMTQPGESEGFMASDHVKTVLAQANFSDKLFDYIVVNNAVPDEKVIEKYRAKGQEIVVADLEELTNMGYITIVGDFLAYNDEAKHSPRKLAEGVLNIL